VTLVRDIGADADLDTLFQRVAPRFARAEPRRRARAFVRGLLSELDRKNGWTLASYAGESDPSGMQRLLNAARWDVDGMRDDLRAYAVERLRDDPHAVLVAHETGFPKKGTRSVGVQRQYAEVSGRVMNVQVGVFLTYASPRGRALVDRELYLPESWILDRERCRRANVPDTVGFAPRPQLARSMISRFADSGVPVRWVAAGEVYGADPAWRSWLEDSGLAYVLGVGPDDVIGTVTGPRSVREIAAGLPDSRLHDWVQVPFLGGDRTAGRGWQRSLLIRGALDRPAFLLCWAPTATPIGELVRVAGVHQAVVRGFEHTKTTFGLDQYQVRRYDAWYRHVTLCMLAAAHATVTRQRRR
jgi:SRSO17 transposase